MKRIIAQTKHFCDHCHKAIAPKSEACKERRVYVFDDDGDNLVCAQTSYYHPKCVYKMNQRQSRFARFKINCQHPRKFQETEYDYSLPGSINGDRCRLCGKLN